jgi:hypothetical protein
VSVIQVYRIDEEGFLIEPIIIDDESKIPSDCIFADTPNGLYKAKFDGSGWIEGADDSYISSINVTPELTELEKLQKQQADLMFELMMKGVI